MSSLLYVIVSTDLDDKKVYWSGKHGWTSLNQADCYTKHQRSKMSLPMSSKPVKVENLGRQSI